MHKQQATHTSLVVGLPRGLTVLTIAAVALIVFMAVAYFGMGTRHMVDRATPVSLKPGRATLIAAVNHSTDAVGCKTLDAYTAAALSNLTDFRERLLSIGIPYFGVDKASKGKNNATNLWKLLEPIISCPPDQPMTRYGPGGDGSKLLCKLPEQKDGGCVIYSLGSHGEWDFEWAVLNTTRCSVYTFDCTWDGASQGPRHSYYKWCVGDPKHGPDFRSWANITATLGHSKVDVMKIDIEGHEYKVFADLTSKVDTLPRQISVEFHFNDDDVKYPFMAKTGAELALTFLHLGQLGYAAISQEINPIAPDCCSELSFFKVL